MGVGPGRALLLSPLYLPSLLPYVPCMPLCVFPLYAWVVPSPTLLLAWPAFLRPDGLKASDRWTVSCLASPLCLLPVCLGSHTLEPGLS